MNARPEEKWPRQYLPEHNDPAFLELVSAHDRPEDFASIEEYALPLALHGEGCIRLQHSISNTYTTAEKLKLARAFQGHVKRVIESPNANHVVQLLVAHLPPASLRLMLEEVDETWDWVAMAKHKFGCRIALWNAYWSIPLPAAAPSPF